MSPNPHNQFPAFEENSQLAALPENEILPTMHHTKTGFWRRFPVDRSPPISLFAITWFFHHWCFHAVLWGTV